VPRMEKPQLAMPVTGGWHSAVVPWWRVEDVSYSINQRKHDVGKGTDLTYDSIWFYSLVNTYGFPNWYFRCYDQYGAVNGQDMVSVRYDFYNYWPFSVYARDFQTGFTVWRASYVRSKAVDTGVGALAAFMNVFGPDGKLNAYMIIRGEYTDADAQQAYLRYFFIYNGSTDDSYGRALTDYGKSDAGTYSLYDDLYSFGPRPYPPSPIRLSKS